MPGFLEANGNVNISTGTKIISISAGFIDCSFISSGTAIFINNYSLVEAVSGTAPDVNGNSTIILRNNWANTAVVLGNLLAFNSLEGLRDAIANSKTIADRLIAITKKFTTLLQSTDATEAIAISATEIYNATPYQYLVNQFQASQVEIDNLVGTITARNKADFESERAINRSRLNVSGDDTDNIDIATGYDLPATVANQFTLKATTKYIDGVRCVMPLTVITLPEAPNGLQRTDGTADFANLASAIVAGGTALTASVITRQDLVLTKLTLITSNEDNIAVIQNNDNNFYSDSNLLKQYVASYVQHEGLREYIDIADAMTAFGYTQDATDKGLWTDGVDLFVPVTRVQRLNKGAYHPVYNYYGTSLVWRSSGELGGSVWSSSAAKEINTISECFDFSTTNGTTGNVPPFAVSQFGNITSGQSGRPTNNAYKFHDAIYTGQIHDSRASSKNKSPQELLAEYSQRDISGVTRGKESVPFTKVSLAGTGAHASVTSIWNWDASDNFVVYSDIVWAISDWFYLYDATDNFIVRFKATQQNNDGRIIKNGASTSSTFEIISGTLLQNTNGTGNTAYILHETLLKPQFETLPWQVLIATPDVLSAEFVNGVYGTWLPFIPTGASVNIPLGSKKARTQLTMQYKQNPVDSWGTLITTEGTGNAQLDSINNLINLSIAAGGLFIGQYSTKASFLELANNAEVLAMGDVTGFVTNQLNHGNAMLPHLIGKVGTGNSGKDVGTTAKILTIGLGDNNQGITIINPFSTFNKPTHVPLVLSGDTSSPTVKAFPYITSENSQYYLQWVYKEMIWDLTLDSTAEFTTISGADVSLKVVDTIYFVVSSSGGRNGAWVCKIATSLSIDDPTWSLGVNSELIASLGTVYFTRWNGNGFGDNNKFTIINGEGTETDDNGNTVLIGQKRVALPFFVGK